MASQDFLLLTDLIYNKGWTVKNVRHDFGKDIDWKATIVLGKNGETKEMQSTEEDFVSFAVQLQKTIDSKGRGRLIPVKDSTMYWDDIEHLVDIDGGKTRSAVNAISSGSFTFSFKPLDGIKKILQDKIPTKDTDVQGVKNNFFETFGLVAIEAQRLLKLKEPVEKSNQVFATYASAYGKVLTRGFLGEVKKTNVLEAYKKYLKYIRFDHVDLVRRIHQQEKYVDFLRQLLAGAGGVDPQNGALAVADAYWRLCELCYPMLYVAQVALLFERNETPETDPPSFNDLIDFLEKTPETKDLVQCVEPTLRNSEAHCASSVLMEKGQVFLVANESRWYPAHEVKRFELSELTNKLNCLAKSLLVALYMELELFEYAFLLLVLNSYEFKMLLVTLAQY
jgi:hypothetical protein